MKLRIKDRRKFNRFILITVFITIITIYALLTIFSLSSSNAYTNHKESIIVKYGDNLWSIAEKLDTSRDIREVVYDIQALNNIKASDLRPGDKLYIPSY